MAFFEAPPTHRWNIITRRHIKADNNLKEGEHIIFVSCPFQDQGGPGHQQQILQEYSQAHSGWHYSLVDQVVAKMAETKDADFVRAWKASIITMVRDFRAPKVVGLYLITGGGKGCELERTNIISLVKELSTITNATLMIKYVDWSSDALFKHSAETLRKDWLQNLEDQSERTFAGCQAPTWTQDGVDRHSRRGLSGSNKCEVGKPLSTAQLMILAAASNKTRDQTRQDMLAAGDVVPAVPPRLGSGDDVVFLQGFSPESLIISEGMAELPLFNGKRFPCASVQGGEKGRIVGHVVELDGGQLVLAKPDSAVQSAFAMKTSVDLKGFNFQGRVASTDWYNWWVFVGEG